ncbi:ATP-binding protein [Siminovitchia sp. 179-K 8D1 HS]|uniref:ATP-binding protein n=1 Tax=Siminovitchia sp. 179-K 8D1 HS TaxID=3142385 RepID=UPI0039A238F0
MKIDILNPSISKVSAGLEGKVILLYGGNNVGKTLQSTRLERPYYIGLEDGLRAIAGIPFASVKDWKTLKDIIKQFTDPRTIEAVKERYQTIIFDGVYDSAIMCQEYICRKHGATHIGETAPRGENRPNLWTAYEVEYLSEIGKLLKSGFTVVFIGHAETDKDTGQINPRGDKRSMLLIRNKADITAYIESNGIDEDNNVINSTAWFVERVGEGGHFARSRFTHIVPKIEFTAENLEKAISDAIKKEEEVTGINSVSFEEQQKDYRAPEYNYEELMKEVGEVGNKLFELGKSEDIQHIAEKHLGQGGKVMECSKGQEQIIAVILDELKELLSSLE